MSPGARDRHAPGASRRTVAPGGYSFVALDRMGSLQYHKSVVMEEGDHLMDDRAENPSRGARVVVLSQDSSLAWSADGPGAGSFARVTSGYEAAAELLAAPTAALVVDLGLLGGKHLGLIEIARSLAVEVFAVGALPIGMTAEDLSGVRLIARCDLPGALGALDQEPSPQPIDAAPAEPQPETLEPAPAWPPAEPTDQPTDQPTDDEAADTLAMVELPPALAEALGGVTAPSKGIEARRSPGASAPPWQGPVRAGNGQPPAPAEPAQQPPAPGLLTPEELRALLGDDA